MGNVNDDPLGERAGGAGEDRFWRELCDEFARADHASPQELADAERLLAGLDDAEVEPLAPARIEQMQRTAMAMAATVASMSEKPETVAPSQPVAPVLSGRFRRFGAAAAALLLAPQFLAAAAVVTVAVTTSYYLANTTRTLPYIDAVRIMMDVEATQPSREASQGRVALDLVESFDALRALDGEDPELRSHAEAVRRDLLDVFEQEPYFVMRGFDATLDELIDPMLDRQLPMEQRHEALSGLAAQLRYGLVALLWVRRTLPPPLLEGNLVYSERLQRMLR